MVDLLMLLLHSSILHNELIMYNVNLSPYKSFLADVSRVKVTGYTLGNS